MPDVMLMLPTGVLNSFSLAEAVGEDEKAVFPAMGLRRRAQRCWCCNSQPVFSSRKPEVDQVHEGQVERAKLVDDVRTGELGFT